MSTLIRDRDLHLLPRDALVKTNELDQADWNFRPVLGWVQRLRLRCVASVLTSSPRATRLLEVGYGSGVFVPELARHADDVFGADVHRNGAAVTTALATPRASRAVSSPRRPARCRTATACSEPS